jgi:gamma-glutamyltranspeptidase/glutathione hydrolase
MAQVMNLLGAFAWDDVGHNSAEHLHRVVECIKIAFADRDALVGDPNFVDVPLARILDPAYARQRLRDVYDPARAHPDCPRPAGAPAADAMTAKDTPPGDTSYLAVVDRAGNAFSATPSDVSYSSPVVPGTGLCPSARGSASWADPRHPCGVAPGKRPRLTPNPAIWQTPEGRAMPFGTPGGDVQVQAMAQFLLNMHVFGLRPQAAVEQARGATYSFPGTFEPHAMRPAQVNLEAELAERLGPELEARGHTVVAWPERTYLAGAVCAVVPGPDGLLVGAADPRRPTLAVGR